MTAQGGRGMDGLDGRDRVVDRVLRAAVDDDRRAGPGEAARDAEADCRRSSR